MGLQRDYSIEVSVESVSNNEIKLKHVFKPYLSCRYEWEEEYTECIPEVGGASTGGI